MKWGLFLTHTLKSYCYPDLTWYKFIIVKAGSCFTREIFSQDPSQLLRRNSECSFSWLTVQPQAGLDTKNNSSQKLFWLIKHCLATGETGGRLPTGLTVTRTLGRVIMGDRNTTSAFSHAEWAHANLEKFRSAEDAKQRSESLRYGNNSGWVDLNNCHNISWTFRVLEVSNISTPNKWWSGTSHCFA